MLKTNILAHLKQPDQSEWHSAPSDLNDFPTKGYDITCDSGGVNDTRARGGSAYVHTDTVTYTSLTYDTHSINCYNSKAHSFKLFKGTLEI